MRWRKLGRVFAPDGSAPWMRTHAANPVAEPRADGAVRVYFSGRDVDNRSHVGWVDLDIDPAGGRVARVTDRPAVEPGPLGVFDDSGATVACVVPDGDRTLLYYLGWNLGVTVPWRNSIGLAVRHSPDGPFEKVSPAPVLDRSAADPFTLSYPCVVRDGGRWRMWYGSCLGWGPAGKDGMRYGVKHAESADGVTWRPDGAVVFGEAETGDPILARPWVVKDGPLYRVWYCRGWPAYRIGYAESADGRVWVPLDHRTGIDVTPGDWDAEMVCYPNVFDHRGRRYLLYNGDGYGRTGFGLAVLEQD
ncbi:MAG: hypothetical protein K2X87_34405 [Gemmataceae bacterium]|nr:hypothetical protein [Gemmataceae bacterium]